ncbi:MAG: hypothetical protein JWO78_959 [Micavibrio sp.]|nr:hypothetical protein [Micavibrio sp.]
MGILLNTILKHVLSVCTLMFVVLPFISNITGGSISLATPGAMAANMPSLSSIIPGGGAYGFTPAASAFGGAGGVFNGGSRPIFL